MEKEKRFAYQGTKFLDPDIEPVTYRKEFFQKEIELESEAFYELRKANGIFPHRLSESGGEELRGIADFFDMNRDTFLFLFSGDELVGSILFLGNYIQSLSVAPRFRRKGYGTKLSMFAINRILESGYSSVVLHTLPGNTAAERLYTALGFKETPGPSSDEERMASGFDATFAALAKSPTVPRVFKEVFGGEAPPDEVVPFSFVTKSDLERCSKELMLGPGDTLLDLACGGGGPGLWIARETGAKIVGVDHSTVAVNQAAKRAAEFGLGTRAAYRRAIMSATGLETAAFDGAVSIDALFLARNKTAVFQEVQRLLRPGARFVFTTWEGRTPVADGLRGEISYGELLQGAGFQVMAYEETADWERLQREVYRRWLESREILAQEIGECVAGMLAGEAQWLTTKRGDGTDELSHIRRIFVVAQKGVGRQTKA